MSKIAICLLLVFLALASVARDPAQVRAFRRANPCPSTGLTIGACPGWVVDHMVPLCAGGPDHPDNMMWQEVRQSYRKDKLERELCKRINQCKRW